MSARDLLDRQMTEEQFLQSVLAYLRFGGWLVYHTRRAKGSDAGFPDLCAVRDTRLAFIELKTMAGRLAPAQRRWREALEGAPPVEYHLFRPADWDDFAHLFA